MGHLLGHNEGNLSQQPSHPAHSSSLRGTEAVAEALAQQAKEFKEQERHDRAKETIALIDWLYSDHKLSRERHPEFHKQMTRGLCTQLTHKDAYVRKKCADALAGSTDPFIHQELAKGLQDPAMTVRRACARSLAGTQEKSAVEALTRGVLKDEADMVRCACALSLKGTTNRGALHALLEGLSHWDFDLRKACTRSLRGTQDPETVDTLIELIRTFQEPSYMHHKENYPRYCAVAALQSSDDPRVTAALIEGLERTSELFQADCARALAHTTDPLAIEKLLQGLSGSRELRVACAQALEGNQKEAVTLAVTNRLQQDYCEDVRKACALSLRGSCSPPAVEALVIARADAYSDVRKASELALETVPPSLKHSTYVKVMRHDNHQVRTICANELLGTDDPQALDALLAGISDSSVEVRKACAASLRGCKNPDVILALLTLLTSEDSKVAGTAASALRGQLE